MLRSVVVSLTVCRVSAISLVLLTYSVLVNDVINLLQITMY